MKKLDTDDNGRVERMEFGEWYTAQVKQVMADPFDLLYACMRHDRHWCA
jgi:hypothetical protein